MQIKHPSILLFDVMSTLVYDPFWKDLPEALNMDLKTWLMDKDRHAWVEFEKGNIHNELLEEQWDERRRCISMWLCQFVVR